MWRFKGGQPGHNECFLSPSRMDSDIEEKRQNAIEQVWDSYHSEWRRCHIHDLLISFSEYLHHLSPNEVFHQRSHRALPMGSTQHP